MKKKSNDLFISHPLQINANRVRRLVNCVLSFLEDTDISKQHRLEVCIKDLTECLNELEKFRVNLCDFRSELQYTLNDFNEEDLPF